MGKGIFSVLDDVANATVTFLNEKWQIIMFLTFFTFGAPCFSDSQRHHIVWIFSKDPESTTICMRSFSIINKEIGATCNDVLK